MLLLKRSNESYRKKESWIRNAINKFQEKKILYEDIKPLSYDEIQELAEKAVKYIPGRVAYFSKQMGVNYGRITIRNQKTRWELQWKRKS